MKVNEIFYSIQGESTFAGLPSVFVRLTGCNLRCSYCDTTYAFYNGFKASVDDVLQEILKYKCSLVTITGGEPLLQAQTVELAQSLINKNFQVLIETNGSFNIDLISYPAIRVMDIKCPDSNESDKMDWENINRLQPSDEVKFVISSLKDFNWAINVVQQWKLLTKAKVLFSPAYGLLEPNELAHWILKSNLPIRLNLQLHKYISIK